MKTACWVIFLWFGGCYRLFQQKWQALPTALQQYCQMGKCFTLLITALIITILCILPSPPHLSAHMIRWSISLTVGAPNVVMKDPLPFCLSGSQWHSY